MPANDSAALIVARFLKTNNYTQSFEAFIQEAGLSEDAGDVTSSGLTLERLLEEKRLYDQSANFEKLNLSSDDNDQGWATSAPSSAHVIETLPSRTNVLNVLVDAAADSNQARLIASTSDRRINIIDLPAKTLSASWSDVQDAPVLSQLLLRGKYHVSASMSGSLVMADVESGKTIVRRKDHTKYIVDLAPYDAAESLLLASAGWDNVVNIYTLDVAESLTCELLTSIKLPTKPESILFAKHPLSNQPILVLTRTDSSHLFFYSAEKDSVMLGQQNLAPHSNAWVAFTPASIALCPADGSTIAAATNSTPHMKLLIVRLLFPTVEGRAVTTPQTPREVALAQQARADREHEAIKLHCNTMSTQTPYSTPLVVWRPNGKGVWVNSDDGIIRGIDILSGKVVSELKGHENGSKVRTLWAGNTSEQSETAERLVSGGFDHKLVLWTP
ncbi:hypothetical protein AMS68_003096 [Peltaster fructicola]|uniref:Uncharacterized protein n=1 Tax=Peltaster fructicola TaxID=286661 RepID=A0A6H0XSI2_9PEZI|nr:hypothetical protein AMS68_003096 [Peltaster fructicola]